MGGRCEALLYALKDTKADLAPDKFQELIEHSIESVFLDWASRPLSTLLISISPFPPFRLLEEIKKRMEAWVQATMIKQFFLQNDIAEDVRRCHLAIDTFITNFNITSQGQMHSTMAQYEKNRQRDHDETMTYLSDIRNQHELVQQTLRSDHAEILGIMNFMQEVSVVLGLMIIDFIIIDHFS